MVVQGKDLSTDHWLGCFIQVCLWDLHFPKYQGVLACRRCNRFGVCVPGKPSKRHPSCRIVTWTPSHMRFGQNIQMRGQVRGSVRTRHPPQPVSTGRVLFLREPPFWWFEGNTKLHGWAKFTTDTGGPGRILCEIWKQQMLTVHMSGVPNPQVVGH